jgi:hypothetical protein
MDPADIVNAIRKEAKRVLESATYSSETQFEYAKRWRRVDRWIVVPPVRLQPSRR